MKNSIHNKKGFSLTELLVSMALGAFLLTGLFAVYLSNKKTYQLEESLGRLQENGRLAIHFLNHDIRMAGYIGCPRLSNLSSPPFFGEDRLLIWPDTQPIDSALVTQLKKIKAAPNTSLLLIQKLDPDTVSIEKIDGKIITVTGHTDFKVQDKLLISNYEQADIVELTKVVSEKNLQKITLNLSLIKYKNTTSEISRFQKIIYYIGDTGRKNKIGKPILALYKRDLNAPINLPQELIEGVEKMELSLTENNLKITLSLNSTDDRHLHAKWSTVIALREPD